MLQNPKCYEITVEDPSFEFESMRDAYDIRLILRNGHFGIFRERLDDFSRDKITEENYRDFVLSKSEIEEIRRRFKLTKSRVLLPWSWCNL